jgi:hypothetical protein
MRSILLVIALICTASVGHAQGVSQSDSVERRQDVLLLASIPKPVVETDWLAARYDSTTMTVVMDNLLINWNDSLDHTYEGHTITKAFSCTQLGTLLDERGDSVSLDFKAAKIEVVEKMGSTWIYRVTTNIKTGPGRYPVGPLQGSIYVMINAGKIMDRRYSIEGSAALNVEVQ